MYELNTEKYPQGIYLVSVKNGASQPLQNIYYSFVFPDWDESTGLFVSESACQNDPNSLLAFDFQGNFKCVPKLAPTPGVDETTNYPAPNGQWTASLKDGLWLSAADKPAVQVSRETASDIIWCPDSSCFFFSVSQPDRQQTLYRVSLPDLIIKMVDEGITSRGPYRWLGDESRR